MISIKSIYLSLIFIVLVAAASADVVFFRGNFSYSLALIYILLLSLLPYTLHDVKMEKTGAVSGALLLTSFALIAAGQYVFSFHNTALVGAGSGLFAAGLALVVIRRRVIPPESIIKTGAGDSRIFEMAGLGVILAAALFLRLYRIDSIPPGVWFDEAQNGNEVINILKGAPLQVFIPRLTMMPAMYFYIASFFSSILGPDIFSLRLVSTITGVLSIAAFYFFVRAALKDVKLALAGAAMLAFSRWHITFSRVAFLGMLTLLLEIICFYFYLKAISGKSWIAGVISGAAMGLSLYTFSGADFIPPVAALHCIYLLCSRGKDFARNNGKKIALIFITAAVIASPLLIYAAKNPEIFTKRFQDLSIMNEIKEQKSFMPVVNSVETHLLMFNYEGDYNGRHNLYKKPMLDFITGALLAAGLFIALADVSYIFYIIWFFVMLAAGIFTISIEAPQAYRIIGIVPCVYMLSLIAVKEALNVLRRVNPSRVLAGIFVSAFVLCGGVINIYQYFVLYPGEKATYLSFSPEANAIAAFTGQNSSDYIIYASEGSKLYGFYPWEQKVICDFINYGKPGYIYMTDDNAVGRGAIAGKKGIIAILRGGDNAEEKELKLEYPLAEKKEFRNRITGEVMFICYYIKSEMLRPKKYNSRPMLFYMR